MMPTLPLEKGWAEQVLDGAAGVAEELGVGDAAGLTHAGGHLGSGAGAHAVVEVGHDGGIALGSDLSGDLLAALVPAGHVVDHNHAGVGAGAKGAGEVGIYLGTAVALDGGRSRQSVLRT